MKLCEIRQVKPVKTKSPLQKNPVAKYAKTSGAGAHTSTKHTRKEKHKNTAQDE